VGQQEVHPLKKNKQGYFYYSNKISNDGKWIHF
jgi:hypothetical protein